MRSFFLLIFIITASLGYCQKTVDSISFGNVDKVVYRNCISRFKVSYPVFSMKEDISYELIGGELNVDKDSNNIIYINSFSPKPILRIFKNKKMIGETKFRVRLIPKPELRVFADSVIKNTGKDDNRIKKATKNISVKAVADITFQRMCPMEANYRVIAWQAYLKRGDELVDSIKFYNTETGDISKLMFSTEKGNEIYIEIYFVKRYTEQLEGEIVSLGTGSFWLKIED